MSRWFALLLTLLLVAACDTSTPDRTPGDDPPSGIDLPIDQRSFDVGVSGLIPRNWPNPSDADWQALFDDLPAYGERFGVHVGWDVSLTSENIPEQVELAYTVTQGTSVQPYVALGFEPNGMTQAEADVYFQDHGDAFRTVAVAVARKYHPGILLLGIESNRYYEKSPSGFDDFVQVYDETYDAVKTASPNTLVATNVQLEYMKGAAQRSGMAHTPHLDLLGRFGDRLDLVTATVYPWLDFDDPADIPDDYFDDLPITATRPLMITETGWPTRNFPFPEVSATEQAQSAYLERLLTITSDLNLHALIWAFPHDPQTGDFGGLFDHISLRRNDGTDKAAWEVWQALRGLTD